MLERGHKQPLFQYPHVLFMLLLRNNNEEPEAARYQECNFSHFQPFLFKCVINSELTVSSVVELGFVVCV